MRVGILSLSKSGKGKRGMGTQIRLWVCLFTIVAASLQPSSAYPARADSRGKDLEMTFSFVDDCDDGYGPQVGFYLKGHPDKGWGTYWLQLFNEPSKNKIICRPGDQICFGAWLKDTSWGCGENCSIPSKGACFPCQSTIISIGLECH